MTELLTAAQMRAIEQAAIDSGEVTGLELMERAGQGVVKAVFEEWPELATTSHRAVVLCGPGNNGGDGFVVARLLKDRGWEVEVFLYGDPEELPPDAKTNFDRWCSQGSVARTEGQGDEVNLDDPDRADLVVDALFGTGLTRPFLDLPSVRFSLNTAGALARCMLSDRYALRVVCIDIPSGHCADSGVYIGLDTDSAWGEPISATLTVAFHKQKLGHRLSEAAEHSGKVVVASIGLQDRPRPEGGGDLSPPPWGAGRGRSEPAVRDQIVRLVEPPFPNFNKHASTHKYSHGHALILSGGPGKGGAGRLAARGALRIGAGLVTLACPPAALQENAARLDAIMVRSLKGAPALTEALEDDRLNALCLGPGLGVGETTRDLVTAALSTQRATVLDADALTSFEERPQALFDQLHTECVLTPHGGEFKRLFPDIAEKLAAPATKGPAYSKVDATRDAAARAGCTILFKGPDTVIADPDGRCSINSAHYDRSAPWLATAGSGDVLAGFITGLLARGFNPHEAASTAAWLHVECALSFGPGLIAEDLPEALPKVFSKLDL